MGEIKSTLDIVMEKTKDLSLTEDEKKAQRTIEIKKLLKGLVQKFKDRTIKLHALKEALESLEKTHNLSDKRLLVKEVLEAIDLAQDNTQLFVLLKDICGENTDDFEALLEKYEAKIISAKDRRKQEIKRDLFVTYAIEGSAVVPNLEADALWTETSKDIDGTYRKKLSREKARLQQK
jgi:hypothetical protein